MKTCRSMWDHDEIWIWQKVTPDGDTLLKKAKEFYVGTRDGKVDITPTINIKRSRVKSDADLCYKTMEFLMRY